MGPCDTHWTHIVPVTLCVTGARQPASTYGADFVWRLRGVCGSPVLAQCPPCAATRALRAPRALTCRSWRCDDGALRLAGVCAGAPLGSTADVGARRSRRQ